MANKLKTLKTIVFRIFLVSALAVSVYAYTVHKASQKVVNLDDQTAQALVLLRSDIESLQIRVDTIEKSHAQSDSVLNVISNKLKELEKFPKKHKWFF